MVEQKTKFWYEVEDGGRHWLAVAGRYDLTDEFDADLLAHAAAEDYHSNHDGCGSSWPLTFGLAATEGGPELWRFHIDRDVAPVFSVGRPVKTSDGVALPRAGQQEQPR